MNLSCAPGVVGILGPNGAGKTTLLSVLATDLKVPEGHAWVRGHDIGTRQGRRTARELIGWLPQRFDLAGGMSVLQTVAYAAWANGIAAKASAQSAAEALALVDLGVRQHDRVRRLSGGQRQRLGLAAALAHKPEILLLDEPTVGLDPQQRVRFRTLIRSASDERTVVLSSHLLEDIEALCDQVVIMNHGNMLFRGPTGQLSALGAVASAKETAPNPGFISTLEAGYLSVLASEPDGGVDL